MTSRPSAPRVRLRDLTLADAHLFDEMHAREKQDGGFNDFGVDAERVDREAHAKGPLRNERNGVMLVERIEEFANLAKKHGYMALNPTTLATGSPVVIASGVSMGNSYRTVSGLSMASGAERLPNYDATGWLVPVLAASPGQPTHAITDDSGQILAYVSGLPGMNLDRYLNQAVGITGLRGFLPQLQTGHIQAQRIVRLK